MNTAPSQELVHRFWKELSQIRTGMLGLVGTKESHSQPMTAHFEDRSGPLWFFARRDSRIVAESGARQRALFHYVGADHKLYACVHGDLSVTQDQQMIDRFWSDEVERWFPDGQSGGSAVLLRFELDEGQYWLPEHAADELRVPLRQQAGEPLDVRATADL